MPRGYLIALLVLLLSGTFELDACSGAFVHSAGRLLQRVHRPGRALDSSCALARGPALHRACGASAPVMQAGPGVGRKRTGLGHEQRAAMSDEQLSAMRASMRKQTSEQRVKDTMEQRRNEFMAQQRAKSVAKAAEMRAAAHASEQARKNKAAAVLAEAVRSQPLDVAGGASQRAAQQQPAGAAAQGGGWELLTQAIAGGEPLSDKQLSSSGPAKAAAPKTSARKPAARAKPAAAPAAPRFHDLRVESEPNAAEGAGSSASDAAGRVTVVDPSDVWTHDRPMPRMKRPEELREIIRICALPLRGIGNHEDAPYHPEEVAIQQVRLTGRRWFKFLEEEDLIDIGKDPARFPLPVREQYLKEIEMEGREITPEDEAIEAMKAYMDTRERRDIIRSIKYVEKLANDYALLFGAPALEAVIEKVKFSAEQEEAAKADPTILQAVSAGHILQEYMRASAEATEILGHAHVLSADWDRGKCLFHEFENMRAAALGQLRAHLRQRAGEAAQQPLQASEVLLEEGQFVDVEIKSKGPLGYLVKVDHKYDGLVYHNDIFQDPPSVGDVTDGWVLKVREDGKVDVTLRPPGAVAKISEGVERLLQALEKNGKRLPVGDKSSPKEIYNAVGLSKKVFKEALGHMYKRKMVVLDRTQVSLLPMARWETGIFTAHTHTHTEGERERGRKRERER